MKISCGTKKLVTWGNISKFAFVFIFVSLNYLFFAKFPCLYYYVNKLSLKLFLGNTFFSMKVFVAVGPARCKITLNCVYYLSNQQVLFLSCDEVNIIPRGLTVSIVDHFLGISEEFVEHSSFMIFQSTRHINLLKDVLNIIWIGLT